MHIQILLLRVLVSTVIVRCSTSVMRIVKLKNTESALKIHTVDTQVNKLRELVNYKRP